MVTHDRKPGVVYTGKKYVVRECRQTLAHGYNYFVEPKETYLAESIARKFLTQAAAVEWVKQEEGKKAGSRVCLFICGEH